MVRLLTVALLLALPLAGQAQGSGKGNDLAFGMDVSWVGVSGYDAWTDGGQGKLRYSDSGLKLARAFVDYEGRLADVFGELLLEFPAKVIGFMLFLCSIHLLLSFPQVGSQDFLPPHPNAEWGCQHARRQLADANPGADPGAAVEHSRQRVCQPAGGPLW